MSEDKVNLYGKVAKFPKNTKVKSAYQFLENIKVNKKRLWYFIVEKEEISGLQIVKYNNKLGFNLFDFVTKLKEYYALNEKIKPYINELEVIGEDKFSVIKNIPNVEIDGKKLITIITENLIQLLYK